MRKSYRVRKFFNLPITTGGMVMCAYHIAVNLPQTFKGTLTIPLVSGSFYFKIMSWNHRILAHENNGEVYFQLHEVYYKDEIPDSYTANPITVGSESLKGIKWTLNKMQGAVKKPILWAGEKFPNECKVKYTCDLCGRNKFDKPSPHNCNNNFRKRGLSFTQNCH